MKKFVFVFISVFIIVSLFFKLDVYAGVCYNYNQEYCKYNTTIKIPSINVILKIILNINIDIYFLLVN